jgi:hypothetical protein
VTAIPTRQVDRVLTGEPAALRLELVDSDGEPLVATEDGLVSVLDGAGLAVVEDAPATLEPVEEEGEGEGEPAGSSALLYTVDPEALTLLDTYTVVWTVTVGEEALAYLTQLEVCGGHLFTIAAFRARASRETTSLTGALIRAARRIAEDRFEGHCHVAFVPRGARGELRGDGTTSLLLPHVALREIYALTIDGAPLSETELAALEPEEPGIVRRPRGLRWPRGAQIRCHYAHGYDGPSGDVSEAVLKLASEYAVPDRALPPRATSLSTDVGVFRISTAGREHPTGIPDVDAVIEKETRERPAVG